MPEEQATSPTAAATTAPIADRHAAWLADTAKVDALTKVFLTGVAKSGTTWLMHIVNGHPEVVVDGEGGFAWRLLPNLQHAVRQFNDHARAHKLGQKVEVTSDEFVLLFRQMVLSRFASYAEASGSAIDELAAIGDKTPQHTLAIDLLASVFPRGRFVNIVRDPRDAAASAWHHFGKSSGRSIEAHTTWFITEAWRTGVEAAASASDRQPDRVLHVRYEDLHAEPVSRVRSILEHIGVDASDASVSACVDAGRFEKHSGGRSRGEGDDGHFYRKGIVGDWPSILPIEAALEACGRIAPLMQRFGYDPQAVPGVSRAIA